MAPVVLLLALASGPVMAQAAASFFDDRYVHDIWLNVNPTDWQTLRANYLLDTYYPAQFNWNGVTANKIGIRSRGSGSRSPEKPNLLLNFSKYDSKQLVLGLPSVILKANNQDASLLREMIAMEMFRRMGLPAPLEAPARLFINGEFFGAYTLVEVVDEAFLRRNFGEDAGYLYDWSEVRTAEGYRFEYLGPDPASYSPVMWDPKNHKSDPDPAPLEAMVRTVNQVADADFVGVVSQYLDLKQFMVYIATENFLADYDGFLGSVFGMNNFYTYRFAGTVLSQFIPWDKDGTFEWEYQPIFSGVNENVLARRAMQVPELRNTYLEALAKAATIAGGPGGWLDQEIDQLYGQVGDMARLDVHKQCTDAGVMHACGAAELEQAVERLRRFARLRSAFVMSEAIAAGYRPQSGSPQLLEGGVVNAADPESPLAPGTLFSIYGEGLAGLTATESFDAPPVTAAGVIVSVGGARAPVLFVSPGQVNAEIPWGTVPGPAAITVFRDGKPGNTVIAEIQYFAPGIFLVAHAAGGVPVSKDQPAAPGEALIIYATGLGGVDSASPDKPTLRTPAVTVSDVPAAVKFSGLVPHMAGLYQVRFEVPAGVPAGPDVPVALTIGGQTAKTLLATGGAAAPN